MRWGILAVFLALPAAAADSVPNAVDLYQRCQLADRGRTGARLSQSQAINAGFCLGFLRGVLMGAGQRADAPSICPPEAVNNGELEQIFMRYFRDFPNKRTQPDHAAAATAFSGAFPCPEK